MLHSIYSPNKSLPKTLTAHDLLKTLAILLMIVDHVGHYFFPDEMWFRVIGRLSVPIWFFLIGYADTREVQKIIWLGAAVVWASAVISGEYLFPATILFMLAFTRLTIDWVMRRALRNYEAFAGMFFFLLFLSLPTAFTFEYGTLGVMFAMFGYMRRHKADLTVKPVALFGFIVAICSVYVVFQSILLPTISPSQLAVFVVGMALLMVVLFNFQPRHFDVGVIAKPLMFTGRYTLEIYVVHLLIFRAIVLILFPDRFALFDFDLMPGGIDQTLYDFFVQ